MVDALGATALHDRLAKPAVGGHNLLDTAQASSAGSQDLRVAFDEAARVKEPNSSHHMVYSLISIRSQNPGAAVKLNPPSSQSYRGWSISAQHQERPEHSQHYDQDYGHGSNAAAADSLLRLKDDTSEQGQAQPPCQSNELTSGSNFKQLLQIDTSRQPATPHGAVEYQRLPLFAESQFPGMSNTSLHGQGLPGFQQLAKAVDHSERTSPYDRHRGYSTSSAGSFSARSPHLTNKLYSGMQQGSPCQYPLALHQSPSNLSPAESYIISPASANQSQHPFSRPRGLSTASSDLYITTLLPLTATTSRPSEDGFGAPLCLTRSEPWSDTDGFRPKPPASTSTDTTRPLHGAAIAGVFKCTFPDCNAPPFQTQYLLK